MNIEMIRAAAGRLAGHARRTPLLNSPFLDEIAGRRVWVKPECLQRTGSFKFRGGWSAISALDPEVRAKGVIAFSSGNHAQGVAHAATLHGVPSVIVMPSDAPALKLENTRALGAEVVTYDRGSEDRDVIGARLADERGLTLIKPFDEPQVIAGQGTIGLEIADRLIESNGAVIVEVGIWLIQNHDDRITIQGPRQPDALHLSPGQSPTPGRNMRVIAVGEFYDHVMCGCFLCGSDHGLSVRLAAEAGNILGDCAVKQLNTLRQVSDVSAQIIRRILIE